MAVNIRLPLATIRHIRSLAKRLGELQPPDGPALFQTIVDAPFSDKLAVTKLDLGIMVLLLVNKSAGTVDRIALSKTHMARGAVGISAKPFESIKIPLDNQQNIINKAITSGKIHKTDDWYELFAPELTAKQARLNQSAAGIECSVVHPIKVRDGGALIFSFYQPLANLKRTHYGFVRGYSILAERMLAKHGALL